MAKENIIVDKTYKFGLRIVKLYIYLRKNKIERELIVQLLRCGTSIGANVEEAIAAQSKRDFISKMSIASKEARETRYWLELLHAVQLCEIDYMPYIKKIGVLIRMLTKIVKTTSLKLKTEN